MEKKIWKIDDKMVCSRQGGSRRNESICMTLMYATTLQLAHTNIIPPFYRLLRRTWDRTAADRCSFVAHIAINNMQIFHFVYSHCVYCIIFCLSIPFTPISRAPITFSFSTSIYFYSYSVYPRHDDNFNSLQKSNNHNNTHPGLCQISFWSVISKCEVFG